MSKMLTSINIHMISDASGETLVSVSRSVMKHFKGVQVSEYVWSLVRGEAQLDNILAKVSKPSFVLYTIVNTDLRDYLKHRCCEMNVPCLSILSRVIRELSVYLGVKAINDPESSTKLEEDYFTRMEAINFAISHDDGQELGSVEEADIVLVGASRTSKSPTSMYLAYQGYKVANVPFVQNMRLPSYIANSGFKGQVTIGLAINPKRLMEIRKNRVVGVLAAKDCEYTDYGAVIREVMESRKVFAANGWPIIDVTYKSVEEIAATIVHYYRNRVANR